MLRSNKSLISALIGVATVVFCAFASAAEFASKLDEVKARGYLIVGTSSEDPPFGFVDEKGDLVGFDIDIGKLFAKAMFDDETKVQFVKQGFPARWANIQTDKVDIGIHDTTVHGSRALQVAFTRPYIASGQTLLVSKKSNITTYADLNNAKYTVAMLTVPAQEAWRQQYFPKAQVLKFDSISAEFTAVKSGRADAAILSFTTALWYAKQLPDLKVVDGLMSAPLNNALFVKTNDFAWWKFSDTVVGEMVGGGLFAEYSAIYEKWFGVKPKSQH
jgi:polar amino acid transport system substrate-binding protein